MILSAETARYWADTIQVAMVSGGICVALPLTTVWMIVRYRTKSMERKMDILMKAVENGQQVDPALLTKVDGGKGRIKRNILNRLTYGSIAALVGVVLYVLPVILGPCNSVQNTQERNAPYFIFGAVFLAAGVGLLISYFVGRKMLAGEMAAEEAEISKGQK